eukprot:CAMPEP_0117051480 /NCGR_PEP_ID=MMETSP0472-20121206/35565_1 /TAXON_ID=693140 ORGANISM="Tiarina fusus, Strain LIS" /NCGR_SAMPLE_ID=MMETSP0472 /ASSEMBLY_ACC=CAM_ASM_000603 /LENGTH=105 /DNA_ID=CAMNT_0004765701 /DNA_START=8 /DNA_END=325 /DNA_ORIENTATION=-
MASNLKKKFEQAANEANQTSRSAVATEWDSAGNSKPLPPTKTASGEPSASGLKAKFEHLANPPPPKKTMGKVAWQGGADQGRKKAHIPGQDHTKPPPPRSLDSLP